MTKSVKIILLQDVPRVGHKDEVKAVALGFAKNWLIRKNLAAVATPVMIAKAQEHKAKIDQKSKEEAAQFGALLKELEGFTLRLRPKKNKQGRLYEGIDALAIAEKLKEKKITIKAESIKLEEPIKQVGEHDVTIAFSKEIKTKIKVIIQ